MRRMLASGLLAAVALVLGAGAAGADEGGAGVPQQAGIIPFAEPEEAASPVLPILLRTGGMVLLGAGGVLAARSWVSTEQTG